MMVFATLLQPSLLAMRACWLMRSQLQVSGEHAAPTASMLLICSKSSNSMADVQHACVYVTRSTVSLVCLPARPQKRRSDNAIGGNHKSGWQPTAG
jgi:hypothetical protein